MIFSSQSQKINIKTAPDVLTVAQVADILHISSRSAYNLLSDGSIRHRKIGRIYRIPKQAVIDYLEQ